jgi:FAD/FMN-containing dehydrogenase
MTTRREFLTRAAGAGAALAFVPCAPRRASSESAGVVVNDIHSQLNASRVDLPVASEEELSKALTAARNSGKPVCIAGGRHAMGGQQFASGGVLLDTRSMQRVISLDVERGVVEAEAGIQWPQLIARLIAMQEGHPRPWGIIQKQTGADR